MSRENFNVVLSDFFKLFLELLTLNKTEDFFSTFVMSFTCGL